MSPSPSSTAPPSSRPAVDVDGPRQQPQLRPDARPSTPTSDTNDSNVDRVPFFEIMTPPAAAKSKLFPHHLHLHHSIVVDTASAAAAASANPESSLPSPDSPVHHSIKLPFSSSRSSTSSASSLSPEITRAITPHMRPDASSPASASTPSPRGSPCFAADSLGTASQAADPDQPVCPGMPPPPPSSSSGKKSDTRLPPGAPAMGTACPSPAQQQQQQPSRATAAPSPHQTFHQQAPLPRDVRAAPVPPPSQFHHHAQQLPPPSQQQQQQQQQQAKPPSSAPAPPAPAVQKPAAAPSQPSAAQQEPSMTSAEMHLRDCELNADFLARYALRDELGCGGFGFVVTAVRREDGHDVAVKFILKNKLGAQQWARDTELGVVPIEVYVIKNVRHRSIIDFVDFFEDDKFFYLVMELHGVSWNSAQPLTTLVRPLPTPVSPPRALLGGGVCALPPGPGSPTAAKSSSPTLATTSSAMLNRIQPVPAPTLAAAAPCMTGLKGGASPSGGPPRLMKRSMTSLPPPTTRMAPKLGRRQSMDLFECIETHTRMPEKIVRYIFRQVAEAVEALNRMGIVHRDIKDENIVIDSSYHVKLIDFGSAAQIPPAGKLFDRFAGTVQYCPPEILQGEKYRGPEQEIFTLGILLYVLMFAEPPFANPVQTIQMDPQIPPRSQQPAGFTPLPVGVVRPPGYYHAITGFSDASVGLLLWMLAKRPRDRPSIEQVLLHPWLTQCHA
ncbi:hypothetical protein H9P43_005117 [Blastocladiella emersonii ATCC 22665]|nr:hypothetical protein H9P43_005117 [Blastocladiella emersonii ATCC 22665]